MKLSVGQRIAGGGSVLLFLFMFLPWFGTKDIKTVTGIVLPARHVTVDAWNPFQSAWFVAIVLTISIAAALFSVLRVSGRSSRELRATASVIAAGAGAVTTILVLYRVLVPIHLVVRWYGLFLALLAAGTMLYGGLRWMDEEGAVVRGYTVADARRQLRFFWQRVQHARRR